MGILASILIAAQIFFVSYEPQEAFLIKTPDIYYEWNDELEECTGYDVNIDDIDFYVVPGQYWYSLLNGYVEGEYIPTELGRRARILLAEPLIFSSWLVKHELAHHHLQMPGHPEPPFNDCEYR